MIMENSLVASDFDAFKAIRFVEEEYTGYQKKDTELCYVSDTKETVWFTDAWEYVKEHMPEDIMEELEEEEYSQEEIINYFFQELGRWDLVRC